MEITKVKERNETVVDFDRARIERAIEKACAVTGVAVCSQFFASVTDEIADHLDRTFFEQIPGVEDIEHAVEMTLADRGLFEAARAYTRFRAQNAAYHDSSGVLENVEGR